MVDHRISPLSSGRNGFHRVQGRHFRSLPGLQLPQKASSQENEGKKKKGGKETKTTEVSKREVKGLESQPRSCKLISADAVLFLSHLCSQFLIPH